MKGWGCDYHEVDDDDDDDGKGGSKGKSISDSISEHKCIVTSNIIYSITVIIPINNREKLENIHLGSGTELENTIYICIPNTRCGIFQLRMPR